MDPLIADYFGHLEQRLKGAGYISDMPALAAAYSIRYFTGGFSIATSDGRIQIKRNATKLQQRADAAHELAHSFADEHEYEEKMRYFHVSAPDLDAHVEIVIDHGADRLLMPDILIEELTDRLGWTAEAVYELTKFAGVSPEHALRRMTHCRESMRVAGFIAKGSYIQHACANYYAPFWPGARMPEPHILFEHGLSMFSVPKSRMRIGLLITDNAAD